MEEKKKESLGDEDDGKEHQNFCILCGKYTKDVVKPLMIGSINQRPVMANGCSQCGVILSNAARIFREAWINIQRQEAALKPPEESKIIVPKLGIPRGLLKSFGPKKK